jgi:uncharacterized protein
MRLTLDSSSNVNLIRSYSAGELRINDESFRSTLIVDAATIRAEPALANVQGLTKEHAVRILELEPEVVLLGTGPRQSFPAAEFGAQFLRAGVGYEVMDTGAACRTFNVLVSEQRRVVALLLL